MNLTYDKLKEAVAEFFSGKEENYIALKSKILEGYSYRFKSSVNVNTGKGGILLLIDACMKEHISAVQVEEGIEVFIYGKWISLAHLKHTKNVHTTTTSATDSNNLDGGIQGTEESTAKSNSDGGKL